jgi:hypothetical protein
MVAKFHVIFLGTHLGNCQITGQIEHSSIAYSTSLPYVDTSTTGPRAFHNEGLLAIPAGGTTGAATATATAAEDDIVILLRFQGSHVVRLLLLGGGG